MPHFPLLLMLLALLASIGEAFLPSAARTTVSPPRAVPIFDPSNFRSDFIRAAALMHSRASPSCTAGVAPSSVDPMCALPIFVRAIPPALRHNLSPGTTSTLTPSPLPTCNASHPPLPARASHITIEFVTLLPSADRAAPSGPQVLDLSTHSHMGQLSTSLIIGTGPLLSGASLTGVLNAWQPPTALASYGALGSTVYYGGLVLGVYVTYRGVTWLMAHPPLPSPTVHVIPTRSSGVEAPVSPPPPQHSDDTIRTLVFKLPTLSTAGPSHLNKIKVWVRTSLDPLTGGATQVFSPDETPPSTASQATAPTVSSTVVTAVKPPLPQPSPAPSLKPRTSPGGQASEGAGNATQQHGQLDLSLGYVHAEPSPNASHSGDTGTGFPPLHFTTTPILPPVDWEALLHTCLVFLAVLLATTPITDSFGLLYKPPSRRSCRYRMERQRRRLAKALRRIAKRRAARQQACLEISDRIHAEFPPLFSLLKADPTLKVEVKGRGSVYVGVLLLEKMLQWDTMWRPFAFPMTEMKREKRRRVSHIEYNGRAVYPHDEVIQGLYVRFLREVLLCPAVHDKLRLFVLVTSAYQLLDIVLEKRFQIATIEAQAFVRDSFCRNEIRVQSELEWKGRVAPQEAARPKFPLFHRVLRLIKALKP